MWAYLQTQIQAREIEHFEDPELKKQLTAVRFEPKAINSKGFLKLEPKEKTKERLGRSPDDADAYVYGIWGLRDVDYFRGEASGVYPHERKKAVYSGAAGW